MTLPYCKIWQDYCLKGHSCRAKNKSKDHIAIQQRKGSLAAKCHSESPQTLCGHPKARCAKGKVQHTPQGTGQVDSYWNAYHKASNFQSNASKVRFHLVKLEMRLKGSMDVKDCTRDNFCYVWKNSEFTVRVNSGWASALSVRTFLKNKGGKEMLV